ncbi:hypothetical protein LCGC14_1570410 [marine sediment metagenome]|uniref:Uncharacterized protein n=1 Tax=marine sediment metagenome TaxID=412755 RepID=A0A0F9J654_9ZZZZ
MIGISTLTQNTSGAITFDAAEKKTSIRKGTARVSRSATLDGGAVVNHLGFSHGDRTLQIYARLSEADKAALWAIFILGVMINVATDEGMYLAAISALDVDKTPMQMTIIIKESLT